MPKRRANGEGNIRKRKDGRWEGRYTAGYDANGKAITKDVCGFMGRPRIRAGLRYTNAASALRDGVRKIG